MPDWNELLGRTSIGVSFCAAYDGECGCGSTIDAGDVVGWVDDELCCQACYDDAREKAGLP